MCIRDSLKDKYALWEEIVKYHYDKSTERGDFHDRANQLLVEIGSWFIDEDTWEEGANG